MRAHLVDCTELQIVYLTYGKNEAPSWTVANLGPPFVYGNTVRVSSVFITNLLFLYFQNTHKQCCFILGYVKVKTELKNKILILFRLEWYIMNFEVHCRHWMLSFVIECIFGLSWVEIVAKLGYIKNQLYYIINEQISLSRLDNPKEVRQRRGNNRRYGVNTP